MKSSRALDRAGVCTACGCLVIQHFAPFTNVMRGCAYALRINHDFVRVNAALDPAAPPFTETEQGAGQQLLREGRS